jgi:hypothetical protein
LFTIIFFDRFNNVTWKNFRLIFVGLVILCGLVVNFPGVCLVVLCWLVINFPGFFLLSLWYLGIYSIFFVIYDDWLVLICNVDPWAPFEEGHSFFHNGLVLSFSHFFYACNDTFWHRKFVPLCSCDQSASHK